MSLADFITISKLGDGAYSSVFKAQRRRDGKVYAVKQVPLPRLTPKEKFSALNEVRLLASFRHPNILTYKEAFLDGPSDSLCIVTEYADGGDLYQRIIQRRHLHFQEEFVWSVMVQTLRGLSALHRLNVMHRDLKSANVFLFANGDIKLGDFNVSKVAKQGLLFTQTGTPYYASPEVWKEFPYSDKSDVWSLGCVVYETAALRPPFRAKDMDGLYKKVVKGDYPRLPQHFSQDLGEVISLMLQTDPAKRPSCDELLRMPALYHRAPYTTDRMEECKLLDTLYFAEESGEVDAGRLPKARYWNEDREERNSRALLPKVQVQMASIHNSFHSPGKAPSMQRPRLYHFSPEPDVSILRTQKQIMRENYGALQPLRRHRTGKEALEASPEPAKNPIVSDRCDRIVESFKRAKVVVDMLKTPNRRRGGVPLYG